MSLQYLFLDRIELLEFNGKRPILKNLTIEPIALSNEQNQELGKIIGKSGDSRKLSYHK